MLQSFQGWAPIGLVDAISSLSFISHFNAISRGVLDLRDLLYFAIMIAAWLLATVMVIDIKKA